MALNQKFSSYQKLPQAYYRSLEFKGDIVVKIIRIRLNRANQFTGLAILPTINGVRRQVRVSQTVFGNVYSPLTETHVSMY